MNNIEAAILNDSNFDPYGGVKDRRKHATDLARQIDALYQKPDKPKIICLCGSSRFVAEMAVIAWGFEKEGYIALGLHLLPTEYTKAKSHLAEFEGVAKQMDALHLKKIELADEVFIVNKDGYIGESTRREIAYATELHKPIKYLVPLKSIHHEVVPGLGWVAPDHPLHPDCIVPKPDVATQPDDDLLLPDEEIVKKIDFSQERTYKAKGEFVSTFDVYPLLEAQLNHCTPLIEARERKKCQKRIEQVFEEIENSFRRTDKVFEIERCAYPDENCYLLDMTKWQALKAILDVIKGE